MFEIFISILPFIIPTSIIGDNLSYLITSLLGNIFIVINIKKLKENRYFYLLIGNWVLIFITQLFISPYIESISGSFLYLNIPIYYLIYSYLFRKEGKDIIFKNILISISVICTISIIYQGIYQGIRIFGNIGYANSYSLLLLIGLYLNKIREKDNLTDLFDLIFLVGILYTGSRTTLLILVIFIVYNLYKDIKGKNSIIKSIKSIIISIIIYVFLEKFRLIAIFIFPLIIILYKAIKSFKINDKVYYLIGLISLAVLLLSNTNTVNRIKNISLNNGSLQERFVYYEDSIKTIIDNPLGNGINMFQYKLYSDATAFYDVKYIHNSFLQVAYDTGIINFIIFIGIIILGLISVIKSKVKYKDYLILAYVSILGHSLLDFDLSFSIFLIILVFSKALIELEHGYKKNKEIIVNIHSRIAAKNLCYVFIVCLSTYLIIYESTILLGKYTLDVNSKLAVNILNVANKISFNKDYRGYFYKADALRNIYSENEEKNYLEEAIYTLEVAKNINKYNPMVIWNLSYLYEEIGDNEKALEYGEELLERERFYPGVYIKQHDYLMRLYGETGDIKYEKQIKELEDFYYKSYSELNKKSKYMNNQLQENYDNIRSEKIDYNIILNGNYEKDINYFNVLDSNKDNSNYKDNEDIIYNNPKDGFIKVKSSLFLHQCIEHWIYSL